MPAIPKELKKPPYAGKHIGHKGRKPAPTEGIDKINDFNPLKIRIIFPMINNTQ